MASLYLTSMEVAAGKSTLCAGLGRKLGQGGRKVGFLKPVLVVPEGELAEVVDQDAEFIREVLALEESAESLCPVALPPLALNDAVARGESTFLEKIEAAYTKLSQGKDIMILEGLSGLGVDANLTQASSRIVAMLGAQVVLIIRYRDGLSGDRLVAAAKTAEPSLLGIVINAVPERRLGLVKTSIVPKLEENGIKVLGVLPEDRALFTISVGDLAQYLGGEVISSPERSGELVENVMIGAMCIDSGLLYFNRKDNKAVIARGNRPDIQLAALATPTRCLILTGNTPPHPNILHRAQETGVPIVVVEGDTPSALAALPQVFSKARFHHLRKLERVDALLEQHFDLKALRQRMGLLPRQPF